MDFRIYLLQGAGDSLPNDVAGIPSTVVQVDADDPLAAARVELNLALEERVASAHWYFVYPSETDGTVRQADHPIAFVDADGEVVWSNWQYDNVTFADLRRAAEHGFFEGDPTAILLDTRPYGDGAPLDWAEFFGWLTSLATAASAYAGTKEVARDLSTAASAIMRVLRRSYRWLIKRGGIDPRTPLMTILAKKAWRTETLSRLLRVSPEEAGILLEALGYAQVAGELYSREAAPTSSLRDLIIEEYLSGDPLEFRWRHKRNRS